MAWTHRLIFGLIVYTALANVALGCFIYRKKPCGRKKLENTVCNKWKKKKYVCDLFPSCTWVGAMSMKGVEKGCLDTFGSVELCKRNCKKDFGCNKKKTCSYECEPICNAVDGCIWDEFNGKCGKKYTPTITQEDEKVSALNAQLQARNSVCDANTYCKENCTEKPTVTTNELCRNRCKSGACFCGCNDQNQKQACIGDDGDLAKRIDDIVDYFAPNPPPDCEAVQTDAYCLSGHSH